jgi:hypothetical protein
LPCSRSADTVAGVLAVRATYDNMIEIDEALGDAGIRSVTIAMRPALSQARSVCAFRNATVYDFAKARAPLVCVEVGDALAIAIRSPRSIWSQRACRSPGPGGLE